MALLLPEYGNRVHAVVVKQDADDGVNFALIVDAQRNQVGRRPADGRPVWFVPVGAAGLVVEGAVRARAVDPNVAWWRVAGGGVGGGGLWAGGVSTGADLGDSGYVVRLTEAIVGLRGWVFGSAERVSSELAGVEVAGGPTRLLWQGFLDALRTMDAGHPVEQATAQSLPGALSAFDDLWRRYDRVRGQSAGTWSRGAVVGRVGGPW